jgi:translation initiation factor 1 (eIF-1/SUI1)
MKFCLDCGLREILCLCLEKTKEQSLTQKRVKLRLEKRKFKKNWTIIHFFPPLEKAEIKNLLVILKKKVSAGGIFNNKAASIDLMGNHLDILTKYFQNEGYFIL